MSDILLIDRYDSVTVLTMNRPEVRNAVDPELMIALLEALKACESDGTRCVVLTGAEGTFSSGADIKKAVATGFSADELVRVLDEVYSPTLRAIRSLPMPIIAAVDGFAAGIGCDMALACDIRLISERGRFAELFIRVGLVPDGGGTYLLPRIIGLGRALELMYTGIDVDAAEAYRIGMANRVYPVGTFMQDAISYATKISQQSPQALRLGKAAMLNSLNSSYDDALKREHAAQYEIFNSEDGVEGFLAFAQKRAPVWKGR